MMIGWNKNIKKVKNILKKDANAKTRGLNNVSYLEDDNSNNVCDELSIQTKFSKQDGFSTQDIEKSPKVLQSQLKLTATLSHQENYRNCYERSGESESRISENHNNNTNGENNNFEIATTKNGSQSNASNYIFDSRPDILSTQKLDTFLDKYEEQHGLEPIDLDKEVYEIMPKIEVLVSLIMKDESNRTTSRSSEVSCKNEEENPSGPGQSRTKSLLSVPFSSLPLSNLATKETMTVIGEDEEDNNGKDFVSKTKPLIQIKSDLKEILKKSNDPAGKRLFSNNADEISTCLELIDGLYTHTTWAMKKVLEFPASDHDASERLKVKEFPEIGEFFGVPYAQSQVMGHYFFAGNRDGNTFSRLTTLQNIFT